MEQGFQRTGTIRPSEDVTHESGATIHWSERFRKDGRTYVPVTCRECGRKFDKSDAHLWQAMKNGYWSGGCAECASHFKQPRSVESMPSKGRIVKKDGASGYVWRHIRTFTSDEQKILVQMIGHPKGYVLEHRAVMALILGRPLTSREPVHHIDGDKMNNSPENLTVYANGEHRKEHHALMAELAQLRTRCAEQEAEIAKLRGQL